MRSTQRSEGMSNVFKKYFNVNTTLCEFAQQFNMVILKRMDDEERTSFRVNDAPYHARFQWPLETIIAKLYTNAKLV